MIMDGRQRTDPDRAICFEVCSTLAEARRNRKSHGEDAVIIRVHKLGDTDPPAYGNEEIVE